MKKRFKSILTVLMAFILAMPLTACGGSNVESVDDTKTQLTVYSYDGGVGNVWLDKVIERFEADFANTSFEEGKVGVQIHANKEKPNQDLSIIEQMEDVLFTEWCNTSSLFSMNRTLDISDIMNVPLNEYLVDGNGTPLTTDTDTIEDKLFDKTKQFFSFSEGKYKGLPHYSHFATLIYNKVLLDDNSLYFARTPDLEAIENGDMMGYFIASPDDEKSCGPNGVCENGEGDDGLPATYDEFFILCDAVVELTKAPFIWNGSGKEGYTRYLLNSIYLNLAGAEKANINWDYDSNGKQIDIIDANGKPAKATVTPDNFGALNRQLEKYQAIEIFDRIIDTYSDYHSANENPNKDNLGTQDDYIRSYKTATQVLFLVEGSYWYNEANDAQYFDNARYLDANFDKYNDFRVFPLPRVYEGFASDVEGTNPHKNVVADQSDSLACINATIANDPVKVKLAKTFLAYCYTQESLADFTKWSNTVKLMNYTVDKNDLLNDYAKHLWDYCQESDYVLPYSAHNNYTNGGQEKWSLHISAGFWTYTGSGSPWTELRGANKKPLSYFNNYAANR